MDLDVHSSPLNGVFISIITKNPLETADAQTARLTIVAIFRGAKSPKLTKVTTAQEISTIINGTAVDPRILDAFFSTFALNRSPSLELVLFPNALLHSSEPSFEYCRRLVPRCFPGARVGASDRS